MAGKNSVFVNNSAPSVDAAYLNLQRTEGNNLITSSGQVLNDAISDQETIGVARYTANNFYTDSGAADAYVLTLGASFTSPVSATDDYFDGMTVNFRPSANSTGGAATVNVGGAGVKSIKQADGTTNPTASQLSTLADAELRYDGTVYRIVVQVAPSTTAIYGTSILPKQITISNGTDTEHDIDLTAGNFQFDDGTGQAILGALTKRLDAAWSAGTGNGGLDTGTVAEGTYYLFAINNPSTGASDALFSLSATSPTLPTDYTKKRKIAALETDGSSNIRTGTYNFNRSGGYEFIYDNSILDVNTTVSTTAVQHPVSIPNSVTVSALVDFISTSVPNISITVYGLMMSPFVAEAPSANNCNWFVNHASGIYRNNYGNSLEILTNNGNVKVDFSQTNGSIAYQIRTRGWFDNNL